MDKKEYGRILAIDYGTKRCGIAVSDINRLIASPLTTVATHELRVFIENYIEQELVSVLVVGEPKRLDGSASPVEKEIVGFLKWFKKSFKGISIHREDEQFTSINSSKSMVEAGFAKKKRQIKGNIDRIAATLILQSYMENKGGD